MKEGLARVAHATSGVSWEELEIGFQRRWEMLAEAYMGLPPEDEHDESESWLKYWSESVGRRLEKAYGGAQVGQMGSTVDPRIWQRMALAMRGYVRRATPVTDLTPQAEPAEACSCGHMCPPPGSKVEYLRGESGEGHDMVSLLTDMPENGRMELGGLSAELDLLAEGEPTQVILIQGSALPGSPYGQEAEELRQGIEEFDVSKFDADYMLGAEGYHEAIREALDDLLTKTDARDSLMYLERKDAFENKKGSWAWAIAQLEAGRPVRRLCWGRATYVAIRCVPGIGECFVECFTGPNSVGLCLEDYQSDDWELYDGPDAP